ncbi:hypothetical protein IGI04_013946 [Brassica rapa subsp. trilocularis]|uniref:Uncharacterized protein n=1 Tax=Brassica rapa subsp. trilocularis TaxID=1813537 RepID=A0ABQ7NAB0_BRACM|nr:hypothetical protein IGI04_013946 [Brassica rapa subsp. trilocularis]
MQTKFSEQSMVEQTVVQIMPPNCSKSKQHSHRLSRRASNLKGVRFRQSCLKDFTHNSVLSELEARVKTSSGSIHSKQIVGLKGHLLGELYTVIYYNYIWILLLFDGSSNHPPGCNVPPLMRSTKSIASFLILLLESLCRFMVFLQHGSAVLNNVPMTLSLISTWFVDVLLDYLLK